MPNFLLLPSKLENPCLVAIGRSFHKAFPPPSSKCLPHAVLGELEGVWENESGNPASMLLALKLPWIPWDSLDLSSRGGWESANVWDSPFHPKSQVNIQYAT